jgi:mRNA-degrading endonuclease toxin of MazEF toxin-antitoxin module
MPIDPSTPIDPGDIYWITLPQQGGSEQSGRRPCIVISRRSVNMGNTVVVVPMSTNTAKASSYKVLLPIGEIIRDITCTSEIKLSVALCQQVRVVDKRAFEGKMGRLSQNAVLAVQLGLAYLFDIR